MLNLDVFFTNHFDTTRLSDDRIRSFTESNLRFMATSGRYPALVAETERAYELYFGAITDEATKTAIREGQTIAVDNAVAAIKKMASRREGAVRSAFGKGSTEYEKFLPHGLEEYHQATLGDIEKKTVRFLAAAGDYEEALPGLKAEFATLLGNFRDARKAQLLTKGGVSQGKTTSATTRDAVEVQLMKNLLTIALDHIGDPAGGLAFFDQSILHAGLASGSGAAKSSGSGSGGASGTP